MSVTDEWFDEFVNECDELEQFDLFGYAASAAARELVENWSDCWEEGGEAFGEGDEVITKTLVDDIDQTIARLGAWRNKLVRGMPKMRPYWWRGT